ARRGSISAFGRSRAATKEEAASALALGEAWPACEVGANGGFLGCKVGARFACSACKVAFFPCKVACPEPCRRIVAVGSNKPGRHAADVSASPSNSSSYTQREPKPPRCGNTYSSSIRRSRCTRKAVSVSPHTARKSLRV